MNKLNDSQKKEYENSDFNNLSLILNHIHESFCKSLKNFRHPYRQFVLSTSNESKVDSRTVVLRDFDINQNTLYFHTDIRSSKYQDIIKENNVQLLFWDNRKKIQIRIKAKTTVYLDSEIAKSHWNKISDSSKKLYNSIKSPGETISNQEEYPNTEMLFPEIKVSDNENEMIYKNKNFSVVGCNIEQIDWLWLSKKGHRRAIFDYSTNEISKRWIMP